MDFEGVIAQLVAHLNGIEGVSGSNPLSSIINTPKHVKKQSFCALIPSFSHLKWMFEWFIGHTTFYFATLQMYGDFSEIKY